MEPKNYVVTIELAIRAETPEGAKHEIQNAIENVASDWRFVSVVEEDD